MNPNIFKKLVKKSREMYDLPQGRCKHFSYILDGNKLVSFGWNFPKKTHTMAHRFSYKYAKIHSELNAIKNFPYPVRELCNFSMVNVRIGLDFRVRMSKPCIKCQELLGYFEIGEVWYSNTCGNFMEL